MDYESNRYVFCSDRCVERFKAEPSRYLTSAETIGSGR
ncbi:MAG: YHS domain-containing protein [Alphaproteobacteria bacterium]|nr:YHS domain-containing protein [Alphaproteobacteria bacterium]